MSRARSALLLILALTLLGGRAPPGSAAPPLYRLFLPVVQRESPAPQVEITLAQGARFPPPYGYGLRIEYAIRGLDSPGRQADYVTTRYSPDGGATWIVDEARRDPAHTWDNLHGDGVCGATQRNLPSGHNYSVQVVLTWHDSRGSHQTYSQPAMATVDTYDCADLDQDGVPDELEGSLAERFFPHMWARWQISDRQQFYPYLDTPGGSVPFSVQPYLASGRPGFCDEPFQCLEVRYGLAYARDCGDNPGNGCRGFNNHLGDSEFYAVLLARKGYDGSWGVSWESARADPSAWRQVLSETFAHWRGLTDSSACHYYLSPRSKRATLYIAEGKHATYHSVRDCDRGGFFGSDYCVDERSGLDLRADLGPGELQNVGNPQEHFLFDTTILRPSTLKDDYDIWSGDPFGQGDGYLNHFSEPFDWAYWWWYNSPQGEGCGDICGCRAGD